MICVWTCVFGTSCLEVLVPKKELCECSKWPWELAKKRVKTILCIVFCYVLLLGRGHPTFPWMDLQGQHQHELIIRTKSLHVRLAFFLPTPGSKRMPNRPRRAAAHQVRRRVRRPSKHSMLHPSRASCLSVSSHRVTG